MIELFQKYVYWKILAHFLANPTTPSHVKEIARKLNISPSSASMAVRKYETDSLLIKEVKGNAHFYTLNLDSPVTKALKMTYALFIIMETKPAEHFLKADGNIISIALYGSYATGEYDEKSDVDFLVITLSQKELVVSAAMELEQLINIPVNVSVFKLSQWQKMAREKDAFCLRVTENRVLLYGSDLI